MAGDWQKLLVTLEANIAEIPQLEPGHECPGGKGAQILTK
jgi:hypothetical protein